MPSVATGFLLLVILAAALVTSVFRADMRAAQARVEGRATVVDSPFGPIEYLQEGPAPAVLVIHGAGGGFDQGELVARAVLDPDVPFLAPSRFGYLGSGAPEGADFERQADAYVWLLDHLGIESIGVVALSQGGPSALFLALRHPSRVRSLTLLSAGVAPVATEAQDEADAKGGMWVRLFRSNFGYWAVAKLFRGQVMGLMGAERDVVATLEPAQREWIGQVIEFMNPASPRFAGVLLDNRSPLPGDRIAGIRAPTLIVHAEDDTLQLFENADFAARTIPGADLLRFERGGHFVVMIEQETVRQAVRRQLAADAPPAGPEP